MPINKFIEIADMFLGIPSDQLKTDKKNR